MERRALSEFSNVNGSFYDFQAELYRGTRREVLVSPPDSWGGRAIQEWARRLARNRCYDPDAEQFARVAEVLDRIYGIERHEADGTHDGRSARRIFAHEPAG